ncbi:MAG: hypothetical protein EON54_28420, partial [Alcaligenaceae bacterium]
MDDSLFITSGVHEREITTPKGTIKIWLRELPNTSYTVVQFAVRSGDVKAQAEAMPRLVAEAICGPDGSPALTFERACELKPDILAQIYNHATSLYKAGDPGKDSRSVRKRGSGTRSRSNLAGE